MRKLSQFLLLLIIMSLFVVTCKKDEEDNKIDVAAGKISASTDTSKYLFSILEMRRDTFSKDSTSILFEAELNENVMIGIDFMNMYKFQTGKYKTGFDLSTKQNITIYFKINGAYYLSSFGGTINVTMYDQDIIQGTFDVVMHDFYDESKKFKFKGQFNCSFTGYDPTVKDIDILPGTMEARVNGMKFNCDAIAADLEIDSTRIINVTGTNDNGSIVLQFINIQPWSGNTYKTGIEYSDEGGYIKASYIKDNTIAYVANELDSLSATIKIVKISSSTIQGNFEFFARTLNDTGYAEVKSGKFNARFKQYQ